MDLFSPIRATTLHPALVHFTLGVVPVIVIAYAVAVARRSERWSFAGDVALWIAAAFTVATAASGLVANALVSWPGGSVATWRWAHLGVAAASSALLFALALVRLRRFRRGAMAGRGTLAASLVLAVLLGVTGWIGGEVLVFHAGIAVAGAGQGALAPTMARADAPPGSFGEAMGRFRGAWADASTTYARMLVTRPSPDGYARIAAAAREVGALSEWLGTAGAKEASRHGGPEVAAATEEMATVLRARAGALERAASASRWTDVGQALGAVTSTCAACHESIRWKPKHEAAHEHGAEPHAH